MAWINGQYVMDELLTNEERNLSILPADRMNELTSRQASEFGIGRMRDSLPGEPEPEVTSLGTNRTNRAAAKSVVDPSTDSPVSPSKAISMVEAQPSMGSARRPYTATLSTLPDPPAPPIRASIADKSLITRSRLASMAGREGYSRESAVGAARVIQATKTNDFSMVTSQDIEDLRRISSIQAQTSGQKSAQKEISEASIALGRIESDGDRIVRNQLDRLSPTTAEQYDSALDMARAAGAPEFVVDRYASEMPDEIASAISDEKITESRIRAKESRDINVYMAQEGYTEGQRKDFIDRYVSGDERAKEQVTQFKVQIAKRNAEEENRKANKGKIANITGAPIDFGSETASAQIENLISSGGLDKGVAKIAAIEVEPVEADTSFGVSALYDASETGAKNVVDRLRGGPEYNIEEMAREEASNVIENETTTIIGDKERAKKYIASNILSSAKRIAMDEARQAQLRVQQANTEMLSSIGEKVETVRSFDSGDSSDMEFLRGMIDANPGASPAEIASEYVLNSMKRTSLTGEQTNFVEQAVAEFEPGGQPPPGSPAQFDVIQNKVGEMASALADAAFMKRNEDYSKKVRRYDIFTRNMQAGDLTGFIEPEEAEQAGVKGIDTEVQVRFRNTPSGQIRLKEFEDASPAKKVAMWKSEEASRTQSLRIEKALYERRDAGLEQQSIIERNLDRGLITRFAEDDGGGWSIGGGGTASVPTMTRIEDAEDPVAALQEAKDQWGRTAARMGLLPEQVEPVLNKLDAKIKEAEKMSADNEGGIMRFFEGLAKKSSAANPEEEDVVGVADMGTKRYKLPDGRIVAVPESKVAELPEGSEQL